MGWPENLSPARVNWFPEWNNSRGAALPVSLPCISHSPVLKAEQTAEGEDAGRLIRHASSSFPVHFKPMKRFDVTAVVAAVLLCLAGSTLSAQEIPTVFRGGDILTMRGDQPEFVEELVIQRGKILHAGTTAEGKKHAGAKPRVVDLAGKTLLPGFIDTHGHMIYFGKNLIDGDLRGAKSIAELITRMREQVKKMPPGAWVVGFGYLARDLAEKRHPSIEELNQVSTDRPVMVVDSSGHLGAGNSAVFKAAGITAETPNPEGGSFTRKPGSQELAGPMEETALNAVRSQRPPFSGELADRVVTGAAEVWASYGQTTAMEAGLGLGNDDIDIVKNAVDKNLLTIDLYLAAKDSVTDDAINAAYSVSADFNKNPGGTSRKLLATRPDLDKRYINRVRLGGIKFWLDGSLDTAWFTEPYTNLPAGKSGDYRGFQQIPNEVLDEAFDRFWTSNLQLNMHMNGDAAADQALAAIEKAVKKYGMRDHRPVFIHGTYLRPDQIQKMKTYGAIPSFLTSSIKSGGDAVVHLWGPDRAAHALASKTLLENGMKFTYSHDAPVSPSPAILPLVELAVTRQAASGRIVGPDERVSPYHALQAVTSMAAYLIKEEGSKGTLEPGKLADLVILEKNPLKVDPSTIATIPVLETMKEGKTVFRKTAP